MSKLTDELEEGFGCDTERSALGGREVAGTGRRGPVEEVGLEEESAEEEEEDGYSGKLPGTLCLRWRVAGGAGVDGGADVLRGGSSKKRTRGMVPDGMGSLSEFQSKWRMNRRVRR